MDENDVENGNGVGLNNLQSVDVPPNTITNLNRVNISRK